MGVIFDTLVRYIDKDDIEMSIEFFSQMFARFKIILDIATLKLYMQ